MTFTDLTKRVRGHLGQQHRYAHCVRVARMSENLARIHGADPAKARVAGMLHDLARLYSTDRLMRESVDYGLDIDEYALEHPIVLHAPLSAKLAQEMFGVNDPETLSAISKHTLGAGEMSPLEHSLPSRRPGTGTRFPRTGGVGRSGGAGSDRGDACNDPLHSAVSYTEALAHRPANRGSNAHFRPAGPLRQAQDDINVWT